MVLYPILEVVDELLDLTPERLRGWCDEVEVIECPCLGIKVDNALPEEETEKEGGREGRWEAEAVRPLCSQGQPALRSEF